MMRCYQGKNVMQVIVPCDMLYLSQKPQFARRRTRMKPSQDTTSAPALTTLPEALHWYATLQQIHHRLASHFVRPEPFQRALRFVQGVLSGVERENG
jgi:hypothetical protein